MRNDLVRVIVCDVDRLACQARILHFQGSAFQRPLDFKNCPEKGMCAERAGAGCRLAAQQRPQCPVVRAVLQAAQVCPVRRKGLPFPGGPVQVVGVTHGDDLRAGCPCSRGGLGSEMPSTSVS